MAPDRRCAAVCAIAEHVLFSPKVPTRYTPGGIAVATAPKWPAKQSTPTNCDRRSRASGAEVFIAMDSTEGPVTAPASAGASRGSSGSETRRGTVQAFLAASSGISCVSDAEQPDDPAQRQ